MRRVPTVVLQDNARRAGRRACRRQGLSIAPRAASSHVGNREQWIWWCGCREAMRRQLCATPPLTEYDNPSLRCSTRPTASRGSRTPSVRSAASRTVYANPGPPPRRRRDLAACGVIKGLMSGAALAAKRCRQTHPHPLSTGHGCGETAERIAALSNRVRPCRSLLPSAGMSLRDITRAIIAEVEHVTVRRVSRH